MSMTQVNAQVSEHEYRKINRLVDQGRFINKADFVRTAVRELLETFPDSVDTSERRTPK